jgi:hypothetical protein
MSGSEISLTLKCPPEKTKEASKRFAKDHFQTRFENLLRRLIESPPEKKREVYQLML